MTPALTMGWTDTHCHTQEQMVETGRAVAFVMDDILIAGLVVVAGSCALFLRCKPWEHQEE